MIQFKRSLYNLIARSLGWFSKLPCFKIFFLKIYDWAFKTYYNLEKYRKDDCWLMKSDFQQKRVKTLLNFITDKKYSHCLDIGCADGYITNLVAPYCRKITGVDISTSAIKQAQRKYQSDKIKFVAESIRTYPLGSAYDLIILGDMLYCLTENLPKDLFLKIIERICRRVKDKGRIVITSYLPRSSKSGKFVLGYSKNYLKIFKNFGFEVKKRKIVSGLKEGKLFKDSVILLEKTNES